MVARDISPDALANVPLGDEHGGNVDDAAPAVETSDVAEVPTPAPDEPPKDEETSEVPAPKKSGPGLRTTNTPMRRAR